MIQVVLGHALLGEGLEAVGLAAGVGHLPGEDADRYQSISAAGSSRPDAFTIPSARPRPRL
jgi:hypothetical protein